MAFRQQRLCELHLSAPSGRGEIKRFKSFQSFTGKLASGISVHQIVFNVAETTREFVVCDAQLIQTFRLVLGQRAHEITDQQFILIDRLLWQKHCLLSDKVELQETRHKSAE